VMNELNNRITYVHPFLEEVFCNRSSLVNYFHFVDAKEIV